MNLYKLFSRNEKPQEKPLVKPLEQVQEVRQEMTEIESWSVTWYVKKGWADDNIRYAKTFISNEGAKKFKTQLEESAKLVGCWIKIDITKN